MINNKETLDIDTNDIKNEELKEELKEELNEEKKDIENTTNERNDESTNQNQDMPILSTDENQSDTKYIPQRSLPRVLKNKNIDTKTQMNAIVKSIKQNIFFYIVFFCCLYVLSTSKKYDTSLWLLILTAGAVMVYGYIVHWISHHFQITEFYLNFDNIFTRNPLINWAMIQFCWFFDFHAITHHDSSINKQFQNIALEFINNAMTQGLLLIISLKVISQMAKYIDNRIIVLWAFFYATVHNINYLYVKPATHRDHHLDETTNYGIDIMDIIFGTKYDWNIIESHNHAAINLVVITAIIMYITNRI
jgi:hypothetical protein